MCPPVSSKSQSNCYKWHTYGTGWCVTSLQKLGPNVWGRLLCLTSLSLLRHFITVNVSVSVLCKSAYDCVWLRSLRDADGVIATSKVWFSFYFLCLLHFASYIETGSVWSDTKQPVNQCECVCTRFQIHHWTLALLKLPTVNWQTIRIELGSLLLFLLKCSFSFSHEVFWSFLRAKVHAYPSSAGSNLQGFKN